MPSLSKTCVSDVLFVLWQIVVIDSFQFSVFPLQFFIFIFCQTAVHSESIDHSYVVRVLPALFSESFTASPSGALIVVFL